jgi:glyoxylase I family protein
MLKSVGAYPVHHITLSVSDVDASVAWYQALFGAAELVTREGEGWKRTRLSWPNMENLRIGLMSHDGTNDGRTFNHLQLGLDHIGFTVATTDEIYAWATKLDELGITHGPIEDVQYGLVVTARDPDNIPIEFFYAK